MATNKKSSKHGGGYVGGFFQLFDWKAKSRKKLFPTKSDVHEHSKQGKKSSGSLPKTQLHMVGDDAFGDLSGIREYSDYSCASSITDDDIYGARAPGVVARLMGLDSLPTSNFSEPNCTPFLDTRSLQDSSYGRKHDDYYLDNRNFVDSKPTPRVHGRPFEKFQTEILPPKSAKSIPATQHKLLSPIKSPAFVPSKSAAHIMEAAARIIEASPQSSAKVRGPVVGSSSLPLKVREIKEKLEASHSVPLVQDMKERAGVGRQSSRFAESSRRLSESNAAKCLQGQPLNKSWNGSLDAASFRVSHARDESSTSLINKGKSISLAIQAKVNVQRREGMNSSTSQSLLGQKEQNDVTACQPFKSQQHTPKKKSPSQGASGVLRPNNQKQNCLIEKDTLPPRALVSNHAQVKKFNANGNSASGCNKTQGGKIAIVSKTGLRKTVSETMNNKDENSGCNDSRDLPRKKRAIDPYNRKSTVEINSTIGRQFGVAEESKKKGMDIVSFTFTTPLTRSMIRSETAGMDIRSKRLLPDADGMKLSSIGYNVIAGDATSSQLNQKLRELTMKAESSYVRSVKTGSALSSTLMIKDPPVVSKQVFQGTDDMEECSISSSKTDDSTKLLLDRRGPSPISVLEASYSTESNSSFDSLSNNTEGFQQSSSIQAQEIHGSGSFNKFEYLDSDMELSDSASSLSTANIAKTHSSKLETTVSVGSMNWETQYVKRMVYNLESMFQNFVVGQSSQVVDPKLFEQLENKIYSYESRIQSKLNRRVLFDCVGELLDQRCERYSGRGYLTWTKGVYTLQRKERLIDELDKEVLALKGMGNCNVDELVEKDMSGLYGRWLDFERDAFTLGGELEEEIFESLVDEVVVDILRR